MIRASLNLLREIDMKTYSADEVAPILKIHVDTVRRYIRQGRLRAVNVATPHRPKYVITEGALVEFMDRNAASQGASYLWETKHA